MPKNSKKTDIKSDIIEDKLTLVEIARKYDVKQPYVSQLKKEVDNDVNFELLKFMYDMMNTKMTWKEKPNNKEINKIKEVRARI